VILSHDLALALDPHVLKRRAERRLSTLDFIVEQKYVLSNMRCLPIMGRRRRKLDSFRGDVEAVPGRVWCDNVDVSQVFAVDDMSPRRALETTGRIVSFLDEFDIVRTDRLHVGILSALLGKEVHLYDNLYGKNRAVYEHSMRERFPRVSMFA